MLEITLKEATGFLGIFAEKIGARAENGIVHIPENKGKGYIQGLLLGNSIGMMIRNFELNEDILSRRVANPDLKERVVMSFNNIFQNKDDASEALSAQNLPSVQLGLGNIDFEMIYPGKTRHRSILIAIESSVLKDLLGNHASHGIFKTIVSSNQPLLFEAFTSPPIQRAALDIIHAALPESLQQFYFKIKAEELICLLFAELDKRESSHVQALNEQDLQRIYQIRDRMLSNLDAPPSIRDLAQKAGMSDSKLKRLFKQIFGESIFRYYQNFRMLEAARLLKTRAYSVSEVGMQMGFTNLSHFSRVFEEHLGVTPKKYSGMSLIVSA
jgi:AraC-like DNA-binding protein